MKRALALGLGVVLGAALLTAGACTADPSEEVRAESLDVAGDTDQTGELQDAGPELIQEDDPRWDCRTMGNHACGVEIQGERYVVTFGDDAEPLSVVRLNG